MDIEFQIHADSAIEPSSLIRQVGQGELAPGEGATLAGGARLKYGGKQEPTRSLGIADNIYYFVLSLPSGMAVNIAANILWEFLRAPSGGGKLRRISIKVGKGKGSIPIDRGDEPDWSDPAVRQQLEAALQAIKKAHEEQV